MKLLVIYRISQFLRPNIFLYIFFNKIRNKPTLSSGLRYGEYGLVSVARIHLNHPQDGSGIFLRNVGTLLPDTTEKTIWISASWQLVTYVIPQRHILNNSTSSSSSSSSSSGLGSSVGIATDYGLDGPGIESRWGARISARPDRPWSPPSLLYNGYWVFSGGTVRPGRAAENPPPSSAEVLKE
jgi:hypothetical protein